ncbi:MAG: RNA polymerase sigma factor [Actinomycetota bacterium]|nr:RNA polymerase sigma factor [Actinomycetota bacterium]
MAWSQLSDAELLMAAQREPEAFGTFYQRHARVILAYFYRRTACAQTSADLTAETFAAAFASRARYRDTGAPARAWLMGIARHQLARSFRRSGVPDRARRRLGIERIAVDDVSFERIEMLVDLAPLRLAVRDAMATLTPKLSDAVGLRVGLDLPYPEVARRLGITEGTARARVARGLTHLLENLETA